MATKKSKKVAGLVQAGDSGLLDGKSLAEVVTEQKLTKMELAEYMAALAEKEIDKELELLRKQIDHGKYVLQDAELTEDQLLLVQALRNMGLALVPQVCVAHYAHHQTGADARTEATLFIQAPSRGSIEIPLSDSQQADTRITDRAARWARYCALRQQRASLDKSSAKIRVVESLLSSTESGLAFLAQLKGMVNRAVRGE